MPKINNNGVGFIPILVLSLLVGVSGVVGYNYYNSNKVQSLQPNSVALGIPTPKMETEVENTDVLNASTPQPLDSSTIFLFRISATSVGVTIADSLNTRYLQKLTSAANKVNVKLTDSAGKSSETLVTLQPVRGMPLQRTLTFNINANITKIEFPKVININYSGNLGEWKQTSTRNGIERFVCDDKIKPEYLYCGKNWDDIKFGDGKDLEYRGFITGCKTNVDNAVNVLKKSGLAVTLRGGYTSNEADTLLNNVNVGNVSSSFNSTGRYVAYFEVSIKRDSKYFVHAYPHSLMQRLPQTEGSIVKDGLANFMRCNEIETYLNSSQKSLIESRSSNSDSQVELK